MDGVDMKIRNGFVSNSSSSSFVLVVEKEALDQTIKNSHSFVQNVIEYLMQDFNCTKGNIGGKDIIMIGHYSSAGGDYTFEELEYDGPEWNDWDATGREKREWDSPNDPYAAFEFFISQLPKGSYMAGSVGDGG